MKSKSIWANLRRFLWILPFPFLWLTLDRLDWLKPLEHITVDWRFIVRGPLDSGAAIYYVNRDPDTSVHLGQDYFSRAHYADAAEALFELGGARAVFLDFILSNVTGQSESLDFQRFHQGNLRLAEVLDRYAGRVVLAGSYSGIKYPYVEHVSVLPVKYPDGRTTVAFPYDPATNPIPELPQFPLWAPSYEVPFTAPVTAPRRVGLIDLAKHRDFGPTGRYLPLFVEVENAYPGRFLWNGVRDWWALVDQALPATEEIPGNDFMPPLYAVHRQGGQSILLPQDISLTFRTAAVELLLAGNPGATFTLAGEYAEIRHADGALLARLPLLEGQLLAVNYYGPWHQESGAYAEEVRRLHTDEIAGEFQFAITSEIWRDPAAWIEAVENPESFYRATRHISSWSRIRDASNPKASLFDLLALYRAYRLAEAQGATTTTAFIRETFAPFQGRYILIGPTDPILQDIAPTPFDPKPTPKVAVHGNLLKTIVDGRYLREFPFSVTAALTLILTLMVGLLAVQGGHQSRANKLGAAFLLFAYVAFAFLLFREFHWVIPLVTPWASALTTGMAVTLTQLVYEERQRSRIKGMFGTYVSPELVDRMIASEEAPQLGGHDAEITAFFSDIQSFSSFSEQLGAGELVELMNAYLDAMTLIIEEERGTLDKYIGDAIVAIFGAPVAIPDHAARACLAAVRIQRRQAELREQWRTDPHGWPPIVHHMRTRIGLNTGTAVVGNMGSTKRFNYTMMGDTVNLAARNESGAKSYGVFTMVSEETKRAAESVLPDTFVFRYLDRIVVKGRTQPVSVYELVGERTHLDARTAACLERFDAGIAAYLNRQWDTAAAAFETAAALEPFQPDPQTYLSTNPSKVLLARTLAYRESPPPDDWDGRYLMTTK